MGNDDLERNERAVASSLADVEAKYSEHWKRDSRNTNYLTG